MVKKTQNFKNWRRFYKVRVTIQNTPRSFSFVIPLYFVLHHVFNEFDISASTQLKTHSLIKWSVGNSLLHINFSLDQSKAVSGN